MACETGRDKIEAYSDGELPATEMRAMGEHLRACPSCTSDLLERVQSKRAIKTAGMRYSPSEDLRLRVQKEISAKKKSVGLWNWVPQLSATFALVAVALLLLYRSSSLRQNQTFAELADLHVSTLASATPVDIISTDRHTVKPWFQGKIPFTFNLPELQNTPFTLEGGKLSYLNQAPGAQLIFKIGNHRISVFIFQDRGSRIFTASDDRARHLTFNEEMWTTDGLRYYAIGDAEASDIRKLSDLLKAASLP
jgi:anti-sigma factor RsiW